MGRAQKTLIYEITRQKGSDPSSDNWIFASFLYILIISQKKIIVNLKSHRSIHVKSIFNRDIKAPQRPSTLTISGWFPFMCVYVHVCVRTCVCYIRNNNITFIFENYVKDPSQKLRDLNINYKKQTFSVNFLLFRVFFFHPLLFSLICIIK